MTDKPVKRVPILDVTGSGRTPDGRSIWLHFKLPEGNEHNFLLDVTLIDKTIDMLRQAKERANGAAATPAARPAAGDARPRPTTVMSISVMTAPPHDGVVLDVRGADGAPTTLVLPMDLARRFAAGLPGAVEAIAAELGAGPRSKLH